MEHRKYRIVAIECCNGTDTLYLVVNYERTVDKLFHMLGIAASLCSKVAAAMAMVVSLSWKAPLSLDRCFFRRAALPYWNLSLPFASSHRKSNFYRQTCLYNSRNIISKVRCSQVQLEDGIDDETCELVSGAELTLGEGLDVIRAYLLKAVKNNNGAGVMLLSDVFGFEDSSTRDFAYRVSCSGYNVLVPDMFRGKPWRKDRPRTEFESWINQHNREQVAKDIATSAKWMADEFVAAGISKKLGIIGFCYGGSRLIETIAGDEEGYFGNAVCFYGTRIDTSLAARIKIPVLFVAGDDDPLCSVNVVREMEKNIKGSKVAIYRGRGHGFVHRPQSPEEDEDAEDAFTLMRNWLHDGLLV